MISEQMQGFYFDKDSPTAVAIRTEDWLECIPLSGCPQWSTGHALLVF